jgi:pimeloyl-ACP methyl ester carboxylesterase
MDISRREILASLAVGIAATSAHGSPTRSAATDYPGPRAINHRKVTANGISMHIAEQGRGPLLILCHGFPESWYSWRHQIGPLAEAGYHVVAPDLRGYGSSDAPADQNAYSIMDLVGDMVGLVTALGATRAVIVGHDWGATVAWHSALLRPDVFPVVAAMSVPFRQRQPEPPLRLLRRQGLYTYYWLYYQDPGVADAEYDKDPKDTLLRTLYTLSGDAPHSETNPRMLQPGKGALDSLLRPDHLPSWLTLEDFDYMAGELAKNGFRNPLNYYRNIDNNWKQLAPWAGAVIRQPTLFIAGSEDHVIRGPTGKTQLDAMVTTVPGMRRQIIIDGAGHFIQQERPQQVTTALTEFLRSLPS